jgi:hypothetical protein
MRSPGRDVLANSTSNLNQSSKTPNKRATMSKQQAPEIHQIEAPILKSPVPIPYEEEVKIPEVEDMIVPDDRPDIPSNPLLEMDTNLD